MKIIRQQANREDMPIQVIEFETDDDAEFPYIDCIKNNKRYFIYGEWVEAPHLLGGRVVEEETTP